MCALDGLVQDMLKDNNREAGDTRLEVYYSDNVFKDHVPDGKAGDTKSQGLCDICLRTLHPQDTKRHLGNQELRCNLCSVHYSSSNI